LGNLFENFENGLDKLAVDLGGISLANAAARDERTEAEKIIGSLFGKAVSAYYANNFEAALNLLNSILEVKPDHATAWANKGGVLHILGRHQEPLAACDKAIEIKPDFEYALQLKNQLLSENDLTKPK
jgi:tetratricopeptide (TPR) repeat protein